MLETIRILCVNRYLVLKMYVYLHNKLGLKINIRALTILTLLTQKKLDRKSVVLGDGSYSVYRDKYPDSKRFFPSYNHDVTAMIE